MSTLYLEEPLELSVEDFEVNLQKTIKEIETVGWDATKFGGGFTLLHWASFQNRYDVVRFILERASFRDQIDLVAKDAKGKEPLDYVTSPDVRKYIEERINAKVVAKQNAAKLRDSQLRKEFEIERSPEETESFGTSLKNWFLKAIKEDSPTTATGSILSWSETISSFTGTEHRNDTSTSPQKKKPFDKNARSHWMDDMNGAEEMAKQLDNVGAAREMVTPRGPAELTATNLMAHTNRTANKYLGVPSIRNGLQTLGSSSRPTSEEPESTLGSSISQQFSRPMSLRNGHATLQAKQGKRNGHLLKGTSSAHKYDHLFNAGRAIREDGLIQHNNPMEYLMQQQRMGHLNQQHTGNRTPDTMSMLSGQTGRTFTNHKPSVALNPGPSSSAGAYYVVTNGGFEPVHKSEKEEQVSTDDEKYGSRNGWRGISLSPDRKEVKVFKGRRRYEPLLQYSRANMSHSHVPGSGCCSPGKSVWGNYGSIPENTEYCEPIGGEIGSGESPSKKKKKDKNAHIHVVPKILFGRDLEVSRRACVRLAIVMVVATLGAFFVWRLVVTGLLYPLVHGVVVVCGIDSSSAASTPGLRGSKSGSTKDHVSTEDEEERGSRSKHQRSSAFTEFVNSMFNVHSGAKESWFEMWTGKTDTNKRLGAATNAPVRENHRTGSKGRTDGQTDSLPLSSSEVGDRSIVETVGANPGGAGERARQNVNSMIDISRHNSAIDLGVDTSRADKKSAAPVVDSGAVDTSEKSEAIRPDKEALLDTDGNSEARAVGNTREESSDVLQDNNVLQTVSVIDVNAAVKSDESVDKANSWMQERSISSVVKPTVGPRQEGMTINLLDPSVRENTFLEEVAALMSPETTEHSSQMLVKLNHEERHKYRMDMNHKDDMSPLSPSVGTYSDAEILDESLRTRRPRIKWADELG